MMPLQETRSAQNASASIYSPHTVCVTRNLQPLGELHRASAFITMTPLQEMQPAQDTCASI